MDAWVAFGIGVLVGTFFGIFIVGLGRMAKSDDVNSDE